MTETTEAAELHPEDVLRQLKSVEEAMVEKLKLLHTHHQEMQQLDYDSDIKVLRPYLDTWMDWHLWASYWIVHAKHVRNDFRSAFRVQWHKAHDKSRKTEIEQSVAFAGSYEERQVYYERQTPNSRRRLDQMEQLVDTTSSFLSAVKTAIDHWDKRRVDTKWELGRDL